ncbi:MAG: hypothetical protein GX205_08170 [Firmicutes bacterium]|jgi:ABC-2 type transport system permease protein|nr:hypothetical protein [Bacillota bacterium]
MQLVRAGHLKKYLQVAEISLTNRVVYLADHFASSIFLLLILFIFSQLWRTVLGAGGTLAGLDSTGMLWYMVFTEVIVISTPAYHRLVSDEVKSGDIAYKLNRPYSYTLYYLAAHCGEFAIRFVTNLAIGAVFAYLTMGPLQVAWAQLGWVIISFSLAMVLTFLMNFSLALLAFWFEDNRPFFWIQSKLVFIFGGMFVPVEAYPAGLRIVSYLLPMRYGVSAPARLMVDFDYAFLWQVLLGQFIWATILSLITAAMFQKGVRRVHVNGG